MRKLLTVANSLFRNDDLQAFSRHAFETQTVGDLTETVGNLTQKVDKLTDTVDTLVKGLLGPNGKE